jgi:hypothetical protein
MAKKKNTPRKKKSPGKKSGRLRREVAQRKKLPRSSKRSRRKRIVQTTRRSPLVTSPDVEGPSTRRGLDAHSAGQSGDTQGLSNVRNTTDPSKLIWSDYLPFKLIAGARV